MWKNPKVYIPVFIWIVSIGMFIYDALTSEEFTEILPTLFLVIAMTLVSVLSLVLNGEKR